MHDPCKTCPSTIATWDVWDRRLADALTALGDIRMTVPEMIALTGCIEMVLARVASAAFTTRTHSSSSTTPRLRLISRLDG